MARIQVMDSPAIQPTSRFPERVFSSDEFFVTALRIGKQGQSKLFVQAGTSGMSFVRGVPDET
jgi:hypothetical protein